MSLIIRPLALSDQAAWHAHWQAYLTFYKSTATDEVSQATFERLTSSSHPERAAFVAVIGDEVVGFVHYIFHAHNWRIEDVCYLQDLFVAPNARGQGAATALIEAVYKAADEQGAPSVYWMTQESNHQARKLYDKIGSLTSFIKYQRP